MVTRKKILSEMLGDIKDGVKDALHGLVNYSNYRNAGGGTLNSVLIEGLIYSAIGLGVAAETTHYSPYSSLALLALPATFVGRALHTKYTETKANLEAQERELRVYGVV